MPMENLQNDILTMSKQDFIKTINNYRYCIDPNLYDFNNKILSDYNDISEFIQWGRRNPTLFAEVIFGIELIDYQKYCFMNTWLAKEAVWCYTRNGAKTTLGAVFLMVRNLLVPNLKSYIICGVGSQSIGLFQKIEGITQNTIPSFGTLTDVYDSEIIKNGANRSGFVHQPSSYHYELYNNSEVFTLNGNYDNTRGKRSNFNLYDEAMNSSDELFVATEPFLSQNADFKLGVDMDENELLAEPKNFQNLSLYCSSAGGTDQYFYKKYKDCAIKMMSGDRNYFCADINCDMVIAATRKGVLLPKPLLTKEKVKVAMENDRYATLREYYNKFDTEGGEGQIISRASIIKNAYPYLPVFKNDGDKLYVIAYDPARRIDNSAVGVAEFYTDKNNDWRMKIVNCQTLMDIIDKNKMPKKTTEQIKILKQMLVDYNGNAADYVNIKRFMIDSGSGGAGVPITDFLCEDFEIDGVLHKGLIDDEFNQGDRKKFPNAVKDVLKLISPVKYKSEMFEATIKMVEEGVIDFPEQYSGNGYVTLLYDVDKNGVKTERRKYPTEKEMATLNKKGINVTEERIELSKEQEIALQQIDAMKTEIVNMYRYKREGTKDRFDLATDKANTLHDDRCYCFVMLGYYLSQLRRSKFTESKTIEIDDIKRTLLFKKPSTIRGW